MARREITQIYDDLDDKPLQETDVHVIRFSIDGSSYVMDVSKENCEKFRNAIVEFIDKARPESISARHLPNQSIMQKTCGNGPKPEDMRSRYVENFPGN